MEVVLISVLEILLTISNIFFKFALAFFLLRTAKAFKNTVKLREQRLQLDKYKIDIESAITNEIDDKLDELIEQCFQEYSILNLAFKSDFYITEEKEIEINKDIATLVAQRLSPVFLTQLSLYYNEESITDVIGKRVFFRVTNFVMEHNNGTGI